MLVGCIIKIVRSGIIVINEMDIPGLILCTII